MIPFLFSKETTDFSSLGLGLLTECTSCKITEERNGEYELEMKYPVSGELFDKLETGTLIQARVNDDDTCHQVFRIYRMTTPMSGQITVYARHVSYDLNGYPVPPLSITNTTAANAMNSALSNSPANTGFSSLSDITARNTVNITEPVSMRAFLGGVSGSILDVFGGEYEFDNKVIHLWKSRGEDNGVTIMYGKNLTDLKQEKSIADMYTSVFPYARVKLEDSDTEAVVMLPNRIVQIADASVLGHSKTLIIDLTDKFGEEETVNESSLLAKAQSYINSHDLTSPKVNLTVSFAALWQSEEYKDIAYLEKIKLCDTVTVYFEKLGVNVKAKVIKTVYDCLLERYDSIEIGDVKSSFADTITNQSGRIDALENAVSENKSDIEKELETMQENFSEKINASSGLYHSKVNGIDYYHNKEELAKSDVIFTFGSNGFAWVSGTNCWNGGSPNWTYGFNKDGIGILRDLFLKSLVANDITAGLLTSKDGDVYFDLDNGNLVAYSGNIGGWDIGETALTYTADKQVISGGFDSATSTFYVKKVDKKPITIRLGTKENYKDALEQDYETLSAIAADYNSRYQAAKASNSVFASLMLITFRTMFLIQCTLVQLRNRLKTGRGLTFTQQGNENNVMGIFAEMEDDNSAAMHIESSLGLMSGQTASVDILGGLNVTRASKTVDDTLAIDYSVTFAKPLGIESGGTNAQTVKDAGNNLMASSKFGDNGYVEIGNLLLQWGKCTAQSSEFSSGSSSTYVATKEITFPIEFSAKPVTMVSPATSVPSLANVGYASVTTKGFTLTFQRSNVNNMGACWFAIGQKSE